MSWRLIIAIASAAALGAGSAPARADHLATMFANDDAAADHESHTYSQMIEDRLTWLGQEMNGHVGKLSMDRLAIRVDGHERRAEVWLGKGDGGMLSMRVGGDIKLECGLAHIDAKISLTIDGHRMDVALPRVDLVPASYAGEYYLEVRLPLLRGTFEPETWFE